MGPEVCVSWEIVIYRKSIILRSHSSGNKFYLKQYYKNAIKSWKMVLEQKRGKTIDPTTSKMVGIDSLTSIIYILIQNLSW